MVAAHSDRKHASTLIVPRHTTGAQIKCVDLVFRLSRGL